MPQASRRNVPSEILLTALGGPVSSTVMLIGVILLLLAAFLLTGVWAGILGIIGFLFIGIVLATRISIWAAKAF